jgi:hypothetical protein
MQATPIQENLHFSLKSQISISKLPSAFNCLEDKEISLNSSTTRQAEVVTTRSSDWIPLLQD